MISIVLYGRNDNYGYNLHKRAALSLNCMAQLLTDPDDEILFVDYNTDDDFPTFPEAIQDTLTDKAQKLLRIFRVRPEIHARWKKSTHLFTLEPHARNIAIRRSNENNRFILSTNTDMIFVPRQGMSLTEIVRDLPYGYYGLPRFEIPETLWESLDRMNAPGVIEAVRRWGWSFYLNEIVFGSSEDKFDAPGDFQLIERKDLFALDGFNENMILGWHVDNNMAKRLHFIHPETSDLTSKCFSYHCDHTRQVTPMHNRSSPMNDLTVFVDEVKEATLASQHETWGCATDDIEEISLSRPSSRNYIGALATTITEPLRSPLKTSFSYPAHWDKITYDPCHILPFVLDILICASRDRPITYFGGHRAMFDLLRDSLLHIGFDKPILVTSATASRLGLSAQDQSIASRETAFAASIFVFDCVTIEGKAVNASMDSANAGLVDDLINSFYELVDAERERSRSWSGPPRRIVMINAVGNRFEALAHKYLDHARTPFSSRLRHGFISPDDNRSLFRSDKERAKREGLRRWILTSHATVFLCEIPGDWTNYMSAGCAGVRDNSETKTARRKRGNVLIGPPMRLEPGGYRVNIYVHYYGSAISKRFMRMLPKFLLHMFGVSLVLVAKRKEFVRRKISGADLASGLITLEFELGINDFARQDFYAPQLIMWTGGLYEFGVRRIEVEPVSLTEKPSIGKTCTIGLTNRVT